MSGTWIAVMAALGGALIGASVSIVQIVLAHHRENDKRYDSLLVTALTFLSGSETERSSGISMIEGTFVGKKAYVKVLVPALTSQAVYLLLHTNACESRTEFYNWLRIMELLNHFFSTYNFLGEYIGEIENSFLIKADQTHRGGLHIPTETLKIWANNYSMDLDAIAEYEKST